MKAEEIYFQEFIKKDINMSIPIFQRGYSWQTEQWKELLDDIIEIGRDENRKSYFIGSIVYKAEYGPSVSDLDIVDGQQRVTTLTLLVCALLKYWVDIDNKNKHDMTNFIINNDYEHSRKLFLRNMDDITLEKVIDHVIHDKELIFDENDSLNIENAFNYFKRESKTDSKIIWEGIRKLMFVAIKLDPEDKSQSIFESINSTGKSLSNSDLIRNYVLMDSDNQEILYKKYWSVIESKFSDVNDDEFDEFIRNYLMVKLGENVTIPNVYKVFKHFKNLKYEDDVEGLVKDIYKYSGYYESMYFGKESDENLKEAFDSLKELEYNVVYRFLLGVYDDYILSMNDNSMINLSKEDFIQIIKYVESYVLRRYVSSLDPNTMNNLFLLLRKNIDSKNYLNSFIANLLQYNETQPRRFPTDDEFNEALKTRRIYNKKSIRDHLLHTLEKDMANKEVIQFDGIQVEHIMPQKLSKAWQNELGENFREVHDTYLHTIGNLTLTGYNPEMKNKTFSEKKEMKWGLNDSNISLNDYFENIEIWNENEIIKRKNVLFNHIKDIWKYPFITGEIKNLIVLTKESKQDIEHTVEELFNMGEEDERTQAKVLYNMLSGLILDLDDNFTEKFNKFYVAYKIKNKNFIKAYPQKQGLKLAMNIDFENVDDSKEIFIKGDESFPTFALLKNQEDVWCVFSLIKQNYNKI